MGTAAKIIGVEDSAISKISGVTLTGVSKVAGQDISSFPNTYSMNFDGANDYVATGFTGAVTSCSFWFKPDAEINTSSGYGCFIGFEDGGQYSGIYFGAVVSAISNELITIFSNGSILNKSYYSQVGGTINTDWHHLVISHTGTQYNIYLDNVNVFTANYNGDVGLITATRCDIGVRILSGVVNGAFPGLIDEVAVWDAELDSDAVTVIWNNGTPTDLSVNSGNYDNSGDLQAWYRLGDNGSFKSTQWLIPNNANKDKVSNYSMDFDGSNDYIDCGEIPPLFRGSPIGTAKDTAWSASMWVKGSSAGGFFEIPYADVGYVVSFGFAFSTYLYFGSKYAGIKIKEAGATAFSTTDWNHIVMTFDGVDYTAVSSYTLYVDGVSIAIELIIPHITNFRTENISIGVAGRDSGAIYWDGEISEVAIWDVALDADAVTTIYNSGTPTDLTSDSGNYDNSSDLQGYWKMGEEATFDGSDWTIPDSSTNSNDGTSANMDIADRVGDAPNSANNAVSINMVIGDREEETP